MISIKKTECLKIINNSKKIVITTHTNPDGDAIGSALGLYYYMKAIGKNAMVINDSVTPSNLEFLDVNNEIRTFSYSEDRFFIQNADLIIILDLNDPKRLRSMHEQVINSTAKKMIIDHHMFPINFAEFYFGDTEVSSTGELIWDIISSGISLPNKALANAIYTAIMTDTGSFRFDRTNSKTHRTIADLISLGANPSYCYEMVYNQSTLGAVQMLGEALSGLELHFDNQVCIMTLTKEMFDRTACLNEETDNFVDKTLIIKGVKLGVLISYLRDKDEIRVSFRSKDGFINARELAVIFGGGGHTHAAGARIFESTIEEAKKQVLLEIKSLVVEDKFYNNIK